MEDRIDKLERLIPKLKVNKKILPLKIECMEWELRALKAEQQVKNCSIADVVKSLPNDEKVKDHIDALPYYGTCTTEYNEGFDDGVKWLKEQIAK